jgi:hypothetical protein
MKDQNRKAMKASRTTSPRRSPAYAPGWTRLSSINADNILVPGGPQSRYHAIVEEAYAALGLIETQVDELRTELEYQHKRLDEIRDAALAQETEQS